MWTTFQQNGNPVSKTHIDTKTEELYNMNYLKVDKITLTHNMKQVKHFKATDRAYEKAIQTFEALEKMRI